MYPFRPVSSFASRITQSPSVLGWAWVVLGGFLLPYGLLAPLVLPPAALVPGLDAGAGVGPEAALFALFDTIAHLYMAYSPYGSVTLGLLALAAGWGLLQRREWARRLGIGLSGAVFGGGWLYLLFRMGELAASSGGAGAIFAVVFGIGIGSFGGVILAVLATPFVQAGRYLLLGEVRALFDRAS